MSFLAGVLWRARGGGPAILPRHSVFDRLAVAAPDPAEMPLRPAAAEPILRASPTPSARIEPPAAASARVEDGERRDRDAPAAAPRTAAERATPPAERRPPQTITVEPARADPPSATAAPTPVAPEPSPAAVPATQPRFDESRGDIASPAAVTSVSRPAPLATISAPPARHELRAIAAETRVEIHVGRLEIIAPPRARAASAPTPAATRPMSLHEYLAARSRAR